MLRVSGLTATIGGATLFEELSFVVNPGECLGIVGPNGSGKTTLLRLIAGIRAPDAGAIDPRPSPPLPMLAQGVDDLSGTVGERFPMLFGQDALQRELELVSARLARATSQPELDELTGRYDELLASLSEAPPSPSAGLLGAIDPQAQLSTLSGGELERLALMDLVSSNPPVLLLDEPTNHLDLPAIEWLEARIRHFPGPVLAVSHDRAFLAAVATSILSLDPATGAPEVVAGGYSDFAAVLERRRERQWDAFHRQQREERALKREISTIESRGRSIENSTIHFYFRKRAAKVARRATTLKARIQREHQSSGHVEKPADRPIGFRSRLESAPASAAVLVQADNLEIAAGERTLFSSATFNVARSERVALLGPNGSGKSTLLRAVQGDHPIAAGTLSVSGSASLGVLAQDDAGAEFAGALSDESPVEWIRRHIGITSTDAANELHRFLGDHQVLQTPIRLLSYGERRRLALARLILQGANLLLLDEPTNHLDLPAREAFEDILEGFDGAIILATHDRYLVDRIATRTLTIHDARLTED